MEIKRIESMKLSYANLQSRENLPAEKINTLSGYLYTCGLASALALVRNILSVHISNTTDDFIIRVFPDHFVLSFFQLYLLGSRTTIDKIDLKRAAYHSISVS